MSNRTHAFTLIELLVVVLVVVLLVGLLLPALSKARRNSSTLRDGAQLNQIHKAMIIWAQGNNGLYPAPGLTNRLAVELNGERMQIPGRGPEDFSINNTANLYSMMIAAEYFTPEILIGPTEVNANVIQKEDFDYGQFDPEADVYWDSSFEASIHNPLFGSNTSYAHLSMNGTRKTKHWRDTSDAAVPIISTRGTEDGIGEGDKYTKSPTLKLHGSGKKWVGNLVYADNHNEMISTFYPEGLRYAPEGGDGAPDNIFASEFPGGQAGGDIYLTMSIDSTESTVTAVYDTSSVEARRRVQRCTNDDHDPYHPARSKDDKADLTRKWGCHGWRYLRQDD